MSDQRRPSVQPGRGARIRSSWPLGAEDPAAVLAGARRALFIMIGVLALLWVIQIANWADSYHLTFAYGIRSRDLASLPDIISAPFLHFSWAHIESNSGPLFIFGFLAAYRGVGKFVALTGLVVLSSGLAAWFFANSGTVGAGASGVVFGYFGYIMVRGFFDRHVIDMLVGVVMALCFAYQFTVLLPHVGVGWQAHIGGLAGGIVGGWLLRERRPSKAVAAAGTTTVATGTAAAGTAAAGTAATGTAGTRPAKSAKSAKPAGTYGGPRAELHQELDDLGL